MMKKYFLLTLMLLLTASAFAVEVEIDGLWYEVVAKAKVAKVIMYKNNVYYNGDIVIPETVVYEGVTCSVTSIEGSAFNYCSGLTSVTIGNSVTSIGYGAFNYCSGLTSVTIGNSVTSIGENAFLGCSGLKKVIVKDIAAWCGISFSKSSNPNYYASSNPLYYAHHLYSDENTEITELIIPNSVTSIGNLSFILCSGLTSVTIPNSVTSIGTSAFDGCSGLKKVIVKDIAAWCGISFSGNTSNPLYYAHHLYSDENTEITELIIPNSVTSIGNGAFNECSGLTSVTIPNSVTSIGDDAFWGCSGLKKVIVKDIAAWCGISFSGNTSNPLSYAQHLYSDENTEITELIIPNSVTSIGNLSFILCSGLTSVTIPNGVTSIGYSAFNECSGLTSVTIGNSVTSIGDGAFYNCPGLTSVTIPNSVTSIGYSAFNECSGLTSVVVGGGVKTISSQAFANCQELTDVTCYAEDVPSTQSDAFEGSYIEYVTLHVPTASIDDYKAIVPWSNFGEMVGLDGTLPDNPEPETPKCAKPTISFTNGELEFSCETEGVEFISEVTVSDAKKNYSNKVSLTGSYSVSVYATKAGYENSEVATLEFTLGAGGTGIPGDANGDGNVTVTDIGVIVDIILGKVNQNARKLENTMEPQ